MSSRMYRTCLRRALLASLLVLAGSSLLMTAALAQSESGRAALTGRVTDTTGGIVPGATVTITATQTGLTRTLKADGAGIYNDPSLPVGTYSISGKADGFGETKVETTLVVGQTVEINLTLPPVSAVTTVTVTAEDEDLTHRADTDNASVIGTAAVENLPTRGRNFTDFALLTPGISQELDRFGLVVNGQRSGNVNFAIDGVDFNDPLQGGQRGGPTSVYFFPQVNVREFQVVRTGLSAEFGRTNSGFVNVVTKSGTNRFHGEALYTNRNPWLTWPDALNDPEATNNQNQVGFGIGGPVIRDKLFFYAGAEKNWLEVPFFVRWNGDCPTAGYYDPTGLSPLCALGASGAGTVPLPTFINAQEQNSYGLNNPVASAARVDWQVSPKNTASLQYISTFLHGLAFGASGIQDAAATSNQIYAQQSQAVILGLTTALSSNRTNDVRVQWVYDNRQEVPAQNCFTTFASSTSTTPTGQVCAPNGPEIDIGDLGTLGGPSGGSYSYRAIREEALDNYSWLISKHSLKFGVDINIEPETQQREDDANGDWTIDTFADYLKILPVSEGGAGGRPTNSANCAATAGSLPGVTPFVPPSNSCAYQFEQILPANGGAELKYVGTQKEFAGYIQDIFKVLPRLTLNMGFRYEAQLEPSGQVNPLIAGTGTTPSDVTQWQPRFGLAWDTRGTGATVFRASVGLLDAHTPAYIIARDFTDNGIGNATINSNYDQSVLTKVPVLGNFTAVPSTNVLNDIYVTNPAFRNPRSLQVSVAIEQRMDAHTALVIAFTQNETWKLQHRLNTNLFQPYIDQATLYPIFPSYNPVTNQPCTYEGADIPCHPNNTIAGYHQNFSTAHSTYRGLTASLHRNLYQRLEGTMNFTWAASRDDDSNERDFDRELALDPLCTACYNRGYSKQDIRNQFNMVLLYRQPNTLRWLKPTHSTTIFTSSFIARTALPYTSITSGSKQGDFNNDGDTANDRPILCSSKAYTICPVSFTQINSYKGEGAEVGTVAGRNTFRQAGFLNWDMRLLEAFRIKGATELQLSAECLNCSRASNLNLGANEVSKFTHAEAYQNAQGQYIPNPLTGYYYSGGNAGKMIDAYDTFRSGGPRQIQLGARYRF